MSASQLPGFSGASTQLLRLLLDGTPRTVVELCAATGWGRSTVRTRLGELRHHGLVRHRSGPSTGGRPAVRFTVDALSRTILAADVGATHATLAVADLTGAIVATSRLATDVRDGPEAVLAAVLEEWSALRREAGVAHLPLLGAGIGLPGPVEHSSGRPNHPPIMPGWDGFDVPGRVRGELGVPVLVDNEVNLMALGEHADGFPDVDDMIVVKVATGVGSGFISNGTLHRGASGAAGDLGHITAPRGGDVPCHCGNTGCLEAIAGGLAVAAALRAKGVRAESAADVVALLRAGDLEAGHAIRQAGRDIGDVLAGCVNMFNPAVIVISGGLGAAGEMILAGVREAIYRRSLPLATGRLRIVPSRAGDLAGARGAAVMVMQHALSAAGPGRPPG
jgi:predicted NBD/HSP70 family sugar kinase